MLPTDSPKVKQCGSSNGLCDRVCILTDGESVFAATAKKTATGQGRSRLDNRRITDAGSLMRLSKWSVLRLLPTLVLGGICITAVFSGAAAVSEWRAASAPHVGDMIAFHP